MNKCSTPQMLKWKSHVFTTMAKRPPACRAHDLSNNGNKSYEKKNIYSFKLVRDDFLLSINNIWLLVRR